MQSKRSFYATFSYNENQDHHAYNQKKALLEMRLGELSKPYMGEEMLVATATYNSTHNLTACLYKKHLFLGFQDKKTGKLSFDDRSDTLSVLPPKNITDISIRLNNAITQNIDNEKIIRVPMTENDYASWEAKRPILDKVIAYERQLAALPEKTRLAIMHSGVYDEEINQMLSSSGKEMHPITEQKWEEYYDMDLNSLGKMNIEAPTNTLEEDILEKAYHKDIGYNGYVDQEHHQENASLQDRFADAVKESQETRSPQNHSGKRLAQEQEDELTLIRK